MAAHFEGCSSRIFENVITKMDLLRPTVFFWSKVAIIKIKRATIVFFSSAANFVRLVFKKSARYIGGTDGQS